MRVEFYVSDFGTSISCHCPRPKTMEHIDHCKKNHIWNLLTKCFFFQPPFDDGLALISLLSCPSLRPDRAEEYREHLLHERCPPGPVQLVRPPSTWLLTSKSPLHITPTDIARAPLVVFRVTFHPLLPLNTLLCRSHMLFYLLPARFFFSVKRDDVVCGSNCWARIAAVHHLKWQKWPFVFPYWVFCYNSFSFPSLPLLLPSILCISHTPFLP